MCQRCGGRHVEDELHRFWLCEDNCSIHGNAIDAPSHLVNVAKRVGERQQCYWFRGIPVESLFRVDPPPDIVNFQNIGNFADLYIDSSGVPNFHIFSDGSGGKYSSDPLLRRCGWGWAAVTVEPPHSVLFARWAPLAGRQTVPSAELEAVCDCVEFFDDRFPLTIHIDAAYVCKTATSLQRAMHYGDPVARSHAALSSRHGRRWARLLERMRIGEQAMAFRWVKSHVTPAMVWSGTISVFEMYGNTFADKLAECAAELNALPDCDTASVEMARAQGMLIRNRLVAVLERCQQYEAGRKHPDAQATDTPGATVADAPAAMTRDKDKGFDIERLKVLGHEPRLIFHRGAKQLVCDSCLRQVNFKQSKLMLHEGVCRRVAPIPTSSVAAMPAGNDANATPPVIGNFAIHDSHRIYHKRGVFICLKCGFVAATSARSLTKQCKEPKRTRRLALNRF